MKVIVASADEAVPVFEHQATDEQLHNLSGFLEVPPSRSARRMLLAKGVRPSILKGGSQNCSKLGVCSLLTSLVQRILAVTQREQLLEALENLITLLQSGVSLESALTSLTSATSTAGSRRRLQHSVLCKIRDSVAQGRALSLALADCPLHFDAVDVALIRAGEDAGELTMALERLIARKRLSSN